MWRGCLLLLLPLPLPAAAGGTEVKPPLLPVAGREGRVDISLGKFLCPTCNTSLDCALAAERGRQQKDRSWRLWTADQHYKDPAVRGSRYCLRKWLAGCNGPTGPEICNTRTEVCAPSDALYDEAFRDGRYELCSATAFMSPTAVTLVITIPLFLCFVSLCALAAVVHHSVSSGLFSCPPAISMAPVVLTTSILIVFSVLTFFSPHFAVGTVGMFLALAALASHSVAFVMEEAVPLDDIGSIDKAQRWLFVTGAVTLVCVSAIWNAGYPSKVTATDEQLGRECAEFYNFFMVDLRLKGPDFNKEDKYWGYCDRDYVADTLWNVTAVVWLSLLLGLIHLLSVANITYRHRKSTPMQNPVVLESVPLTAQPWSGGLFRTHESEAITPRKEQHHGNV